MSAGLPPTLDVLGEYSLGRNWCSSQSAQHLFQEGVRAWLGREGRAATHLLHSPKLEQAAAETRSATHRSPRGLSENKGNQVETDGPRRTLLS